MIRTAQHREAPGSPALMKYITAWVMGMYHGNAGLKVKRSVYSYGDETWKPVD